MQEIIDNDPVIKQLDQELADINESYIPRLREMKKEDPMLFKKMQKLGIIDKDFK
jgi:phage host-nuclease inhibitor protein Gam